MDRVVAARMTGELVGQELAGWRIEECVGHGKSALVFRATKGDQTAAVKVFDREMVERFGADAQRERVERERKLVGKHHPNLIEIYDADENTTLKVFFVVMEYFDGPNLHDVRGTVPSDRVQPLLSQVAAAAEFLEGLGLAHRDIKPENIGVTRDFARAVLFDLGVLRPVALGNITDDSNGKAFVGTLRYSPPEFLFRLEDDTVDGWRAVTFYQLGGVLHDLITGQVLFAEYTNPFARLVDAVKNQTPAIVAPDVSPDLVILAQSCLHKAPSTRLALVTWESFRKPPASRTDETAARERIAKRIRVAQSNAAIAQPVRLTIRQRLDEARAACAAHARDVSISDPFPPLTLEEHTYSNHACVRCEYASDKSIALLQEYTLFFDIEVIDSDAGVFRIRAGAVMAPEGTPDCIRKYAAPKFMDEFSGTLSEVTREFVQKACVLSLDAAQAAGGCASETWLAAGDLNV